MKSNVTVTLDAHRIRFTPDGKICVSDAIEALTGFDKGHRVWELLKKKYPEISDSFSLYQFQKNRAVPVADSRGWQKIQDIVFDYLMELA
jgi:hypothetical protein